MISRFFQRHEIQRTNIQVIEIHERYSRHLPAVAATMMVGQIAEYLNVLQVLHSANLGIDSFPLAVTAKLVVYTPISLVSSGHRFRYHPVRLCARFRRISASEDAFETCRHGFVPIRH